MNTSTIRIALFSSVLAGCASSGVKHSTTAIGCEDAAICEVSGFLTMKSDGHGFIGEVVMADGSCIDVSLPEEQSRKLIGQPPRRVEVQGPVLPFPFGENIMGFKVNGRDVGFGSCQDFYIFVRDE